LRNFLIYHSHSVFYTETHISVKFH